MKEQIKNGLIILLVVLIGLFGLFGGRAVKRFDTKISVLESKNNTLQIQIDTRDVQIKWEQDRVRQKDKTIDSLTLVFKAREKVISGLQGKLSDALSQLNTISSDSSYVFLKTVAYNYHGTLKYLFNELQLKGIHGDWFRARNSEKIIPELTDQISNAKQQIVQYQGIELGLKKTVDLQKQSLADCSQQVVNETKIAKDLEKTANRERARKNFWRMTTAVGSAVGIVIGLLL